MNMRVAGPNGKSVEEENHDVDDHGRRSDGRQGLGADKAADHDGIHRVVEHLKQISQHQGKGKQNHLTDDRSGGHISRACLTIHSCHLSDYYFAPAHSRNEHHMRKPPVRPAVCGLKDAAWFHCRPAFFMEAPRHRVLSAQP